jgi:hypothetical protein
MERVKLAQQRPTSRSVRVHGPEVDDVGPVLTVLVAVAHQFRGDHVTVGLVVA